MRLFEAKETGSLVMLFRLFSPLITARLYSMISMLKTLTRDHAWPNTVHYMQHPLRAQSWSETPFKRMINLCHGRFRCDGCQFGLKNHKTDRPLQKPWGWFSSLAEIRKALNKVCTHDPGEHDKIEGDITSSTATYPPKLCAEFTNG